MMGRGYVDPPLFVAEQAPAGFALTEVVGQHVTNKELTLADFTDEEICREYHWRSLKKLGDQRIGTLWL